jgi:hypothetical protein
VLAQRLVKAANDLEGEAVGVPLIVAGLQFRLGLTLLHLGKAEQAISLFAKSRATRSASLGAKHPDTLQSMNELALAQHAAGKLAWWRWHTDSGSLHWPFGCILWGGCSQFLACSLQAALNTCYPGLCGSRYHILSRFHRTPRGGVDLALDLSLLRCCVLKRANCHAGIGRDGRDARECLRHEADVLFRLPHAHAGAR